MSESPPTSSAHPRLVQLARRLQQARFTQLLAALFLMLFMSPVAYALEAPVSKVLATWLVVVTFSMVVLAAAFAVSETMQQARWSLGLALACLVVMLSRPLLTNKPLYPTVEALEAVLTVIFLTYVVCLIVQSLFRRTYVTFDVIAASLCGYLLIGIIFSVLYSIVITIDPEAVSLNSASAGDAEALSLTSASGSKALRLHFGDHRTVTSLYFSFVTLTTLGYGDLTPMSMPARMLTVAEALIGQLYLVVLVARLVALHIATTREGRESERQNLVSSDE